MKYDLKRKFATTPMGVYQPSSGSLYPALRRLEAKGLVKAQDGTGESARGRRVYEPTQAGRAAHATWLRPPLEDRHPGLALEHGLAVHRASLRWTRRAIAALRDAPVDNGEEDHGGFVSSAAF